MGIWLSFQCPSPAFIYNILQKEMKISSVYNKKKPFMLNISVNVHVQMWEHDFFFSQETWILPSWEKKESTLSTELWNLNNIILNYLTYLQYMSQYQHSQNLIIQAFKIAESLYYNFS